MKQLKALAHFSDLHFGSGRLATERAKVLVESAIRNDFQHVIVTGDITNRGRWTEYEEFLRVFAPLIDRGRLIVVPGNHDRNGDNVAEEMCVGYRVQTLCDGGLYCVLVDSTAPHNRVSVAGHGQITRSDLQDIDHALRLAPRGALVVVAMHHHPYPLPEETTLERLSAWLGLPFTGELARGAELLEVLHGRCDLVLHGHRHVPTATTIVGPRSLSVFNAGSSTELAMYRCFGHAEGLLVGTPTWLDLDHRGPQRTPSRTAVRHGGSRKDRLGGLGKLVTNM